MQIGIPKTVSFGTYLVRSSGNTLFRSYALALIVRHRQSALLATVLGWIGQPVALTRFERWWHELSSRDRTLNASPTSARPRNLILTRSGGPFPRFIEVVFSITHFRIFSSAD